MKTCSICDKEKPATEEFFNPIGKHYHTSGFISACRVCYKIQRREWRQENKEQHKKDRNTWHKANPHARRATMARRRDRTPKWAELDLIYEFYRDCPKGYHVDHIIPLKGKTVSGLHVLNNLQYLTATDNAVKGNSYASD